MIYHNKIEGHHMYREIFKYYLTLRITKGITMYRKTH